MNSHPFDLRGERLLARGTRALYWPAAGLLCVSDLHLGKSDRIARRSGAMLPPYETDDTLTRLEAEVAALSPRRVVCLGDSFDDRAAAEALTAAQRARLTRLSEGRDWVWIEGNHDPGQLALAGRHAATLTLGPLSFRHIAETGAAGEVSGHYHPKARLVLRGTAIRRPCFLIDGDRAILPAFGTYTGGLDCSEPPLAGVMRPGALAVITGPRPCAVPIPRPRATV